MKAWLEFLRLKVTQFGNTLRASLRWPVWYFALMCVLLFLIAVEVLGTWSAWAYLMLGFGVWGYRRVS